MKLLNREPTPEMLSIISNEKEVFPSAESLYAALYDAAPEADAQAEIAKRDERIKELEERLAESVGGFKRDLVKQLQDCRKAKERQSTEISRLNDLIEEQKGTITALNAGGQQEAACGRSAGPEC